MSKPSITLTKAHKNRLLQKALELPANQEKITAAVAKMVAHRTDMVFHGMLTQVGELLRNPTMTEKTKVVKFRAVDGFDEGGYPRYVAKGMKVPWADLSPQYWKNKPKDTRGVFWKNSGKLSRAYDAAMSGRRGKIRAKALSARLTKGQRAHIVYELAIPALPWPLSDVIAKPFAYGQTRTPVYSFKGYQGGLSTIMFMERPYSARTDLAKRRERYRKDAGIEGPPSERARAPARPWLRQLASTFRRDMIRALSSR